MIAPASKPEAVGNWAKFPRDLLKQAARMAADGRISRNALALFMLIVDAAVSFGRSGRTPPTSSASWAGLLGWSPARRKHIPDLSKSLEAAGLVTVQRAKNGNVHAAHIFILGGVSLSAGEPPAESVARTFPDAQGHPSPVDRGTGSPAGGGNSHSEPKSLLRKTELRNTAVAPSVVSLTKDAPPPDNGNSPAGFLNSGKGTTNGKGTSKQHGADTEWVKRLGNALADLKCRRMQAGEVEFLVGWFRANQRDTPREPVRDAAVTVLALVMAALETGKILKPARSAVSNYSNGRAYLGDGCREKAKDLLEPPAPRTSGRTSAPTPLAACASIRELAASPAAEVSA